MTEQPPPLAALPVDALADLLATLPQLVWIAAGDGSRLEFLNARWLEYTGQSLGQALIGANDAIHPADRPGAETAWRHSLDSGEPYECLMRLRRHDGAYRWHMARCQALRDADGRVARWYGSSTDVHDGVMAARDASFLARLGDLPAAARDEDDLVTAAAIAIGAHLDGTCRVVSEDAGDRGGRDARDRATGRSTTGEPEVRDAAVRVPLLRGGRVAAALEVTGDQGRRWESRELVLLKLAAQRVWHAMERLRLLRGLASSEHRLQMALRSGGIGIHEFDIGAGQLRWDARVRELWGIGPDVPVDYQLFVDTLHPDDRARVEAAVAAATDPASSGEYRAEYRVLGRDGVERWVSAAGQVSFVDGRAEHLIGTVHDVSDRKRAELEREQLLAELREADREKDRLLATVGHELRNPLGPTRTAVDLLRAQSARLPAGAAHPLGVLERQVAQMSRIVDDLLDAARVASGHLTLHREPTDLAVLLRDAVDAARGAIEARRHTLQLEAGAAPAWADVDPVRVRQVLGNLLANAAKYTPQGGHLTARLDVTGGEATVSIQDDGVGLAPEHLSRVFEMFYRVPAADGTPSGDGLGIGLALARRLVDAQGGRIEAASGGPGRGTTLRVTFPLVTTPGRPALAAAAAPRHASRVLIVDDNRDAADTLALLLGMFGCATAVAYTGGEAIARADAFKPEVVLLDLQLPDIDGHTVCGQLRAEAADRPLRIVAVSGRGDDEDYSASAAAGFDGHLVKPVALETLHPLLGVS
jgi:PAS domain S-box-containing protein